MQSHASLAQEVGGRLCTRPLAPQDLHAVAQQVATLGPQLLHDRRCSAMCRIRELSSSLRPASDESLQRAPTHVQQVLRVTAPSGAHPALLLHLLEEYGWHDLAVVHDLLHGFPLVGHVPVDARAPEAAVRQATMSSSQLLAHAPTLAPYLAARHSRGSTSPEAGQVDCSIFQQTLEEIALGRMALLTPPDLRRPLTRRFGVAQRSAKGVAKIRCIDDFAENLVNDTVTVS